jgi:hypothetical protein
MPENAQRMGLLSVDRGPEASQWTSLGFSALMPEKQHFEGDEEGTYSSPLFLLRRMSKNNLIAKTRATIPNTVVPSMSPTLKKRADAMMNMVMATRSQKRGFIDRLPPSDQVQDEEMHVLSLSLVATSISMECQAIYLR